MPTGWRRAGQLTRDVRRATSWLGEDLDRAEEVFGASDGWFKLQLCGPWTWAAQVESGAGQPCLRDEGFRTDLAEAWREASAGHLRELASRLPRRGLVLQVDEPSLPAVLDGRIATASGFSRVPAVGASEAAELLRRALGTLKAPVVLHCCDSFPFEVARAAGVAGVSFDCAPRLADQPDPMLAADAGDQLAVAFEAGVRIMAGVVPVTGPADAESAWLRLRELWRRSDIGDAALRQLAVSPACGLAGTSPVGARAALAAAAEVARRCADAG